MKLTILMDNPNSWYYPHAKVLEKELAKEHEVVFVASPKDIPTGDCAFFLSVEQLVKKDVMDRNKHNIVVHSSALPKGKGWSPLTWQILEGKNDITCSLFEAKEAVDAGQIYLQDTMHFEGHELEDELHQIQAQQTTKMILKFVKECDSIQGKEQTGEETFYKKRGPADSELDPNKTIAEQFNLFRVVNNKKYPAFFNYKGHKYILKIEKGK